MENIPSSEAYSRSASQKTPRPSLNPMFHYNVCKISGSWCVELNQGADKHSQYYHKKKE
jgi:hypothetical protein